MRQKVHGLPRVETPRNDALVNSHCERSVAIHFHAGLCNDEQKGMIARRKILAMTPLVNSHCERSVAIHLHAGLLQ
jgi:hypothetical protein